MKSHTPVCKSQLQHKRIKQKCKITFCIKNSFIHHDGIKMSCPLLAFKAYSTLEQHMPKTRKIIAWKSCRSHSWIQHDHTFCNRNHRWTATCSFVWKVLRWWLHLVCTDECTGITNLVLCIGVLNSCLVFSNLIHLPEDTLNGEGGGRRRRKLFLFVPQVPF